MLTRDDDAVLRSVAPDVFDHAVSPAFASEFLRDPRHHLAVAIDQDIVIGFASAVHYVHPDKPPELWINEVGVAESHRRKGLARQLLLLLFDLARSLGCRHAWVLTDRANPSAANLYSSMPGATPPSEPLLFEFDLEVLNA
ncbi:GNAT family N-acetyltransferase [Prosthecobacter sp.]|uniref:GNAT family N-acetyltransferase n=1 Tax=Prosthecobacter sp. TaxID=1965333 RepID=UPI003782DC1A